SVNVVSAAPRPDANTLALPDALPILPGWSEPSADAGRKRESAIIGRVEPWFEEMKRRRVFRALIGYGIVSFAVLQIIEPVMHGLDRKSTRLNSSHLVTSYAVFSLKKK